MATDSDEPRVPVQCDACETTTRVALSKLAEAITRHNEGVHDGEPIAEVDPDIKAQIADMAATDMGLLEEDA